MLKENEQSKLVDTGRTSVMLKSSVVEELRDVAVLHGAVWSNQGSVSKLLDLIVAGYLEIVPSSLIQSLHTLQEKYKELLKKDSTLEDFVQALTSDELKIITNKDLNRLQEALIEINARGNGEVINTTVVDVLPSQEGSLVETSIVKFNPPSTYPEITLKLLIPKLLGADVLIARELTKISNLQINGMETISVDSTKKILSITVLLKDESLKTIKWLVKNLNHIVFSDIEDMQNNNRIFSSKNPYHVESIKRRYINSPHELENVAKELTGEKTVNFSTIPLIQNLELFLPLVITMPKKGAVEDALEFLSQIITTNGLSICDYKLQSESHDNYIIHLTLSSLDTNQDRLDEVLGSNLPELIETLKEVSINVGFIIG